LTRRRGSSCRHKSGKLLCMSCKDAYGHVTRGFCECGPKKADQSFNFSTATNTYHFGDEDLDNLSCSFAEDVSCAVEQSLERAGSSISTACSCPLQPTLHLRQLYLAMISTKPHLIFEILAVPLKDRLLHKSCHAVLEGPRLPIRVNSQRAGWSEQVLDKEAFCIGRANTCEVQLDEHDTTCSRIHMCVFNLPGSIILVDGWSYSSTKLEYDGELTASPHGTSCVFLVPHGKPAILYIGREMILINSKRVESL